MLGNLVFSIAVLASCCPAFAEVITWNCRFNYRIDEDGKNFEPMLLVFKVNIATREAVMEGNIGSAIVDI